MKGGQEWIARLEDLILGLGMRARLMADISRKQVAVTFVPGDVETRSYLRRFYEIEPKSRRQREACHVILTLAVCCFYGVHICTQTFFGTSSPFRHVVQNTVEYMVCCNVLRRCRVFRARFEL